MPERGDKRDALSLAASLTNLTFDYIDGVVGSEIPTKALPVGQEHRGMPNSTLGSWRAHMNSIRTYANPECFSNCDQPLQIFISITNPYPKQSRRKRLLLRSYSRRRRRLGHPHQITAPRLRQRLALPPQYPRLRPYPLPVRR